MFPSWTRLLPSFTKDENVAGFGGYVQPLESGIKSQHVWVFSDRMCRQDLHGSQVYDGQHVIFLSRLEREPSQLIQRDSVRAFNAVHGVAAKDLHSYRIDCYNFVLLVNGHQDVVNRNRRPYCRRRLRGGCWPWANSSSYQLLHPRRRLHRIRRHVGGSVRKQCPRGNQCALRGRAFAVFSCPRRSLCGVPSTMHRLCRVRELPPPRVHEKSRRGCHDFAFLSIEDNDLVGIHVSDVKPSLGRVKALVIEADCWARHGHIRDLLERDLFSEAAFERRAASRPIEKINNVSAKTLLTLRVRITCLQRMFSEYVLWEERSV
jgi:hypothetical protein